MANTVHVIYFSPTHTTKKTIATITQRLARETNKELAEQDITTPANRPTSLTCDETDILVFGYPVYAGRIPELVSREIKNWTGGGAQAVIVGVYGNRHFDDALLEASDLLSEQGFNVIAAAGCIGQHSFTPNVGAFRPDEQDLQAAEEFAHNVACKIAAGNTNAPAITGNRPYRDLPQFPDIRPATSAQCVSCGACVRRCPVGVIDKEDPGKIAAGCILCHTCVKVCTKHAKSINHDMFTGLRNKLETNCSQRREPEFFL